jgi:UDP-N-acetylmuramate dehydrogenase
MGRVVNLRELSRKIKISGPLRAGEPMAEHTSFRIGGPADLYAAPRTREELDRLLSLCREESAPLFLLGGGTNILVADRGVRGVVVDLTRLRGVRREGDMVIAEGGTPMSEVAEFALTQGLAGLEFAYFLPGSVGGAVWMNARCYERSVSDVLARAEYLHGGLPALTLSVDPAHWGYKLSPFQQTGDAILGASFALAPGDPVEIRARMQANRADREAKGHFLHPCAGSVFKNNRAFGAPTGKIIDSLGLKGCRIGGAQVAPFHGNIIVNTGGATARDVRALIELVEAETAARLGYRLEREVILVGEW